MNILGISCYYHDSAAALIKDGKIIAAAEEERFSRKKHDSSFPKKAIDFCLQQGNIIRKDLDYVVFYEKPFRKFHRIILSSLATYPQSYNTFREAMRIWLTQKLWIKQEISSYIGIDLDRILFCEHHLSHAASCFYPSPFKKAAILTVDGVGEWATSSFGIGEGNKITLLKEIHFPQSLGLLYSAFTAFLGFEVNEGEWKVMGLAPYGKPKYADKVWKTVKQYSDGSFSLDFSYFSFHYSDKYSFSSKLIELFGDPILPEQSHLVTERSADIAASIQKVIEELLISMARFLKKETNLPYLCISGGVALNSVANYKILQNCGFKNIYLQPACGDSGGALGGALYLYHHVLNNKKHFPLFDAYLGQQFGNLTIEQFLKQENIPYKKLSYEKLIEYTADKIAQGKVIGWMQGRFEWGPRALGARSILADARNPKMKDIINAKVKFREAFRPFAPSVLAEFADDVFDLTTFKQLRIQASDLLVANEVKPKISFWKTDLNPMRYDLAKTNYYAKEQNNLNRLVVSEKNGIEDLPEILQNPLKTSEKFGIEAAYPLRFMLYVIPVKREWRKKVSAITHADNTARPQLVYGDENPLYHKLITSFYKKTGVPLVLNTSFNLKGEPIVASPLDAYSTFQRSGIDILVMGNYVCEK